MAHDHDHPEYDEFYSGLYYWMRDGSGKPYKASCCNRKDCAPIDDDLWRPGPNGYQVWWFNEWIDVPVVERPKGVRQPRQAVVCAIGGRIVCFTPGVLS